MLRCDIINNYTQEKIFANQSDLTFNLLSNDFTTLHTHNAFWEFLIVLEGKLINYYNKTETTILPNTIVLLRPNDMHALLYKDKNAVLYINFVITDRLIRQTFENAKIDYDTICGQTDAISFDISENMRIKLHQEFLSVLRLTDNEEKEKYKRYILFKLINQLQKHYLKASDNYPPMISKLNEYIAQENLYNLNVESLANKMNLSRVSLNKLIQSFYHKTASEFIIEYKMNYAKQLLLMSNKHIYEISDMLGYTPSSFNKAFKNIYKQLPSDVRKNISENNS